MGGLACLFFFTPVFTISYLTVFILVRVSVTSGLGQACTITYCDVTVLV